MDNLQMMFFSIFFTWPCKLIETAQILAEFYCWIFLGVAIPVNGFCSGCQLWEVHITELPHKRHKSRTARHTSWNSSLGHWTLADLVLVYGTAPNRLDLQVHGYRLYRPNPGTMLSPESLFPQDGHQDGHRGFDPSWNELSDPSCCFQSSNGS